VNVGRLPRLRDDQGGEAPDRPRRRVIEALRGIGRGGLRGEKRSPERKAITGRMVVARGCHGRMQPPVRLRHRPTPTGGEGRRRLPSCSAHPSGEEHRPEADPPGADTAAPTRGSARETEVVPSLIAPQCGLLEASARDSANVIEREVSFLPGRVVALGPPPAGGRSEPSTHDPREGSSSGTASRTVSLLPRGPLLPARSRASRPSPCPCLGPGCAYRVSRHG
jgi:hypothetical protein